MTCMLTVWVRLKIRICLFPLARPGQTNFHLKVMRFFYYYFRNKNRVHSKFYFRYYRKWPGFINVLVLLGDLERFKDGYSKDRFVPYCENKIQTSKVVLIVVNWLYSYSKSCTWNNVLNDLTAGDDHNIDKLE